MMFQFTKPQIKLSKIKCQHKKNFLRLSDASLYP